MWRKPLESERVAQFACKCQRRIRMGLFKIAFAKSGFDGKRECLTLVFHEHGRRNDSNPCFPSLRATLRVKLGVAWVRAGTASNMSRGTIRRVAGANLRSERAFHEQTGMQTNTRN